MKKQRQGYFPDDCWELIFQKLREDDERDLDSISLVSKRFLSISNWMKLSLNVNDETLPLLPNLLRRFRHIETIVIKTHAHKKIDGLLDDQIARSGLLNLRAMKFWCSTEPLRDGFRALALHRNVKNNLKKLREDDERELDSISSVSKRFLLISNRVKLSLNVNDMTLPLLPNLLHRFRHIETIVIDTNPHKDIDGLVDQISRSGVLNLQAIKFRWCMTEPPRHGFKALALNKNIKNNLKKATLDLMSSCTSTQFGLAFSTTHAFI
ncbi:hypothetical protein RHGRI_000246 [Rhododendron griersonianum]|uniref:F-box domain-containing protein n=1 Tax=Rhododendron griersonianum TaxID=479676 RepID=A0AAV6LI75_9ERIC|nr:hypothetical protein RHGRI_000246 [Rhododendron griersonianum]